VGFRSRYDCRKHSAFFCTLRSLCDEVQRLKRRSYASIPWDVGRYAFSSTNCNEIDSRDSFTTAKRTASQARSAGKRGHDFAYPKLHDSSSMLLSVASS
jgi:membrane-associated PAP2 superfamily phosphatase